MHLFRYFALVVLTTVVLVYTDLVAGDTTDDHTVGTAAIIDGNTSANIIYDRVFRERNVARGRESEKKDEDTNMPVLKKDGASRIKRKAARSLFTRWPNKIVPFKINYHDFSSGDIQEIYKAIEEWRRFTCIQFREANEYDYYFVQFFSGDGCWSNIGFRQDSQNKISLGKGCRSKGVIVHEIGHLIGFYHEQSRPDRDDYVKVLFENFNKSLIHNFRKENLSVVNTYGLPYDYESAMHYEQTAFSNNGKPTIITLNPKYQMVIGNRKGLSYFDIKQANLMYSCSDRCPAVQCPGHGFVGKDCRCWCPGQPVQLCDVTTPTLSPRRNTNLECSDQSIYCPSLAWSGDCYWEYVRNVCKMSCKTCETRICRDNNVFCPGWQKLGYCFGHYANYMANECPWSCNMCRT